MIKGSRRARLEQNSPANDNRGLAQSDGRSAQSLGRQRTRQQQKRSRVPQRPFEHRSNHIELEDPSAAQRAVLEPSSGCSVASSRQRQP